MKNKKWVTFIITFMMIFTLLVPRSITYAEESRMKQLKINQTTLEFKEIIYVDVTGSDTTGDGSEELPFQSVVKAFDYMNENCKQDGAVVINDGEYDIAGLFSPNHHNNLNLKYDKMKLTLIAKNLGKVKLKNNQEFLIIETNNSLRINLNFYGIIFDSSYSNSCLGGDDWGNSYYNCILPKNYGGYNRVVPTAKITVQNSIFIGNPSNFYTITPLSGTATNCASTTKYMDPSKGTISNALYDATLDADYNITTSGWKNAGIGTNPDGTKAHIGVYGGQFAWGSTVEEVPEPSGKLKVILEKNEILQLSVDNDLTENTKMIWTSSDVSVATVDVNGSITALAPGNTIIAVKNQDGLYTDFINVLVVDDATDLRLAIDLKSGASCRLSIDSLSDTIPVTWQSLNEAVATVNNKGKVTATGKGLTIISVLKDNEQIGQIYVRVR